MNSRKKKKTSMRRTILPIDIGNGSADITSYVRNHPHPHSEVPAGKASGIEIIDCPGLNEKS